MQGEPTQQTIGRGYSSAREYGSAGGRPTRYSVEDMASGLGLRDAEYDDKTTRTVENVCGWKGILRGAGLRLHRAH